LKVILSVRLEFVLFLEFPGKKQNLSMIQTYDSVHEKAHCHLLYATKNRVAACRLPPASGSWRILTSILCLGII